MTKISNVHIKRGLEPPHQMKVMQYELFARMMRIIWPSAVTVPPEQLVRTHHPEWTLSQERQFMEELVYKRLTMFLTVAAALITGAIGLRESPTIAAGLLLAGTALCWVLQQTVHRAQLKLDIILQILFADDSHPVGRINNLLNDKSRVRLVGVAVPSAICLLLTVLTCAQVAFALSKSWHEIISLSTVRVASLAGFVA